MSPKKTFEQSTVHSVRLACYQDTILEAMDRRRAQGYPTMSVEEIVLALQIHPSRTYQKETQKYTVLALAALTWSEDIYWENDQVTLVCPA